jgi:hypothetical protein
LRSFAFFAVQVIGDLKARVTAKSCFIDVFFFWKFNGSSHLNLFALLCVLCGLNHPQFKGKVRPQILPY